MQNSYPVGQAPWEIQGGSAPQSFPVGQAPWETDIPVSEQPKKRFGRKVVDFFTDQYQGVAKAGGALAPTFTSTQAIQAGQSAGQLIQQARKLPLGDPRRRQLLETANRFTTGAQGQAQQRLEEIPTTGKAATDIALTAADILTAGTYGKAALGLKTLKLGKAVPSVIAGAEKIGEKVTTRLGARSAQKANTKIVEIVSPKLTAKETGEQVAKLGTTKTGLFGKIALKVDPYVQKVADTVQKYVPKFNPRKTISENLNATKDSVKQIAIELKDAVIKSGKDKLYTFKELASKMDSVVKPIVIKSDAVLSRQFNLAKEAALKIARQKGGKVSNLLDARKAFDDLVEKEFPNLYDNASKPMRAAITSMRDVMNDFIAENVEDVAFKESLKIQRQLFRAIENMAEKIAAGPVKEIGTTALKRFGLRHPLIKSIGRNIGIGAVGGGAVYGGIRKLGE